MQVAERIFPRSLTKHVLLAVAAPVSALGGRDTRASVVVRTSVVADDAGSPRGHTGRTLMGEKAARRAAGPRLIGAARVPGWIGSWRKIVHN